MNYHIKNIIIDGKPAELYAKDGRFCRRGELSDMPREVDGRGLVARPGLFDIHAHGALGFDTMEGHLSEMAAFEFSHGITSWLPTTMTMPYDEVAAASAHLPRRGEGEAKIPGFHLEGPYICEKYKGAQNSDFLAKPNIGDISRTPHAKMVTLAPELDGAIEYIKNCPFVVSLGHTDADYDTALAAFRAGAKCLTHTCNAMPPLLHRAPGPIGAAITADAYVQVISDGIHLHPAMVMALYRIFGRERMVLISDSVRATGLSDGNYLFGGQAMLVRGGIARTEEGALAGSTSTLYDCVRAAVSFGIPEADAYYMASKTPAMLMGLPKGELSFGYDAEMILVKEDGTLAATYIFD